MQETTSNIMQKWFTVLLATLILSTVVSATGVLFVKPTNETLCPQQPCYILEHYAQSWQLYLTSNTIVQFLPGEHVLEGDWNELTVENILNLTLIGSDSVDLDSSLLGIPMATSIINCRRGRILFLFHNITELFIGKLTFSGCGGGKAAFTLHEVSDLILDSVTIRNSTGTGLVGINLRNLLIHHSSFLFNQATKDYFCSGNIMLFYAKCSERIETYTMNITSSWILYGNATTEIPCVGGAYMVVSDSCYNVQINIHNTTLKENMGGNMFLILNSFASSIITITDSHFEAGYNSFGGGLLIATEHDASQYPQHAQSNLVYINNTEFVGNHAKSGGAVAVFPYSGTNVYINGSKFQNNTAQDGGHITILSSFTCASTNMTTAINNSIFEDGKATGSGGGVALQGTFDIESQCTNHISISNTRFVGNHAEVDGGAVALWGYIGMELYIDKSEFYKNTAPRAGGHLYLKLLSDHALFIVVNNSHFQSGKAVTGGGISVLLNAADNCIPVSSTKHNSVYILNSRFYRNAADLGGGIAIDLFNQSCIAANILIHNVSISRNNATMSGGNIYLGNFCTGGNSITISRTIVEYGNATGSGGGMGFSAVFVKTCVPSAVSLKPTTVNIVDSTFQYNTACYYGGGLSILFMRYCCSVKMNITNVKFSKNKVQATLSGAKLYDVTSGGNIMIYDSAGLWFNNLDDTGLWFNNSVRIHNCLVEGGEAEVGGGITIKHTASWQKSPKVEWIAISSTQFICNRATQDYPYAGASLQVVGNYSRPQQPLTPSTTKKITITDTTFDGTCDNSTNVMLDGFPVGNPFLPPLYNVVFINVSFQGYSTNLSTYHSQQLFDDHLILNPVHSAALALYFQQPGVMLYYISNATFIDCEFFESTVESALTAVRTNTVFGGNITFRHNIATYGGGLSLVDNSVMYLMPNTHILFSHNHATYAGGAIYVQSDSFTSGNLMCFYQFDAINQNISDLNIQIAFENNTAYFAGSALYGGFVDFCSPPPFVETNISFGSIFQVQNTDDDPTAISSDPYMACPCNGDRPYCGSRPQVLSVYTYPGALFHLQAVVVGQKNGIVPGVVRATVRNSSAILDDLQYSQATGKSCTTLNYTVYSSQMEETITCRTETIPNRLSLIGLIINVTLLNCPWGFTLTGAPPKCDCADELRKHHINTCDITTNTITRPPPLWISYYHSGNNTESPVEGVLVHDNCPFDYCKPEQLSIQLNDSDKQCAFNHSGILCGACQPGLSLALGTSRCLKCSNKYLMLLFAFTAAGLALVFLLTLTNMTVSEGTINGLIFYANIIHINRAIFFPNESSGVNKIILNILSTFISWINLDLGIETCFYNGMDMYTKAWLQFLFPIYIWTIVGGMIVSSHYSTTAAKVFRRHAVKVLATLFLLSFAKLLRTIITALSFTFLTYPDGTKTVWLYDSNIEYLHGKHIPLFIAALLALLFLLISYTLVLFFIQCLAKLDCRIFFWVKKLKPLFDAYTGPYKDRYRFWTGFLLIVRTILYLIFTLGNPGLNLAAISVTSTCLAFSPAVYKKAWLTLLEYSLLLNLSAVSVATFYCHYTQFSCNEAVVVYISVGTALVTFVGILVYHLCQCTINSRAWKTVSDRVTHKNNDRELVNVAVEESDEEEEEEPAQAEIRPLMLEFNEYREPVLVYDDQD